MEKRLQKKIVVKGRGTFHLEDFEIRTPGEKPIEKSEFASGQDRAESRPRKRRKRVLGSPEEVEALLEEEERQSVNAEALAEMFTEVREQKATDVAASVEVPGEREPGQPPGPKVSRDSTAGFGRRVERETVTPGPDTYAVAAEAGRLQDVPGREAGPQTPRPQPLEQADPARNDDDTQPGGVPAKPHG
jgi:hypothetical protein